jgi:hypothetical protein
LSRLPDIIRPLGKPPNFPARVVRPHRNSL